MTLENDIRLSSLSQTVENELPKEFFDWANLNHYRNLNQKIGLPKPGEERIIFMGDSITEEWGNLYPDFFSNKPYINRGIGGQTTPQMLIRFRPDVIDLQPTAVVILAGTNDVAGNTGPATVKMITDNLISMAEMAMFHKIKVLMSSILPVYKYPWNEKAENPPEKIASINQIILEFSERNNLGYIDYYAQVVDDRKGMKSEFSEDGVHLNRAGYKVLSEIAESVISKYCKT